MLVRPGPATVGSSRGRARAACLHYTTNASASAFPLCVGGFARRRVWLEAPQSLLLTPRRGSIMSSRRCDARKASPGCGLGLR